jgi:feruloyl-CoA synthase
VSVAKRESESERAPLRPVRLGALHVAVEPKPDGTLYLRCKTPLGDYPASWIDSLEHWAETAPDRLFLAQRGADGEWRQLTYGQTRDQVRRVASGLSARNLSAERPIAILSGNSIEHALLALAAMYAGIPYAPVSPAYSLMSSDFGKLRYILGLLTPGLV